MRALHPARSAVGPAVLIALGSIAIVIFASLFDGSFVQNDTAQYVSMAENLMAGQGLATSLVWTAEHHLLGGLPVAQTNMPPGYPMLIALVSQLGVEPLRAALLVSVACFSVIPLVLYQILRAGGQPAVRCLAMARPSRRLVQCPGLPQRDELHAAHRPESGLRDAE